MQDSLQLVCPADWQAGPQAGASTPTDGQECLDFLAVHQLAVGHSYLQAARLFSKWDNGPLPAVGGQSCLVLMPGRGHTTWWLPATFHGAALATGRSHACHMAASNTDGAALGRGQSHEPAAPVMQHHKGSHLDLALDLQVQVDHDCSQVDGQQQKL